MVKFALPQSVSGLFDKLPFKKRNKTGSHMRAHARHGCVLIADMQIVEKGLKIDGMVIELSRGGIRFREASSYILDRRGTKVAISVSGNEYPGVIVNIDAHGYGIKLDSLIPEEEFDKMVANSLPGFNGGAALGEAEVPASVSPAAEAETAEPTR